MAGRVGLPGLGALPRPPRVSRAHRMPRHFGREENEYSSNELNFPPSFERLVLNTRWKALDEIYKIYMYASLHTFAPLRSQNFSQRSSTFFRE